MRGDCTLQFSLPLPEERGLLPTCALVGGALPLGVPEASFFPQARQLGVFPCRIEQPRETLERGGRDRVSGVLVEEPGEDPDRTSLIAEAIGAHQRRVAHKLATTLVREGQLGRPG
jgi:hypothetical protein